MLVLGAFLADRPTVAPFFVSFGSVLTILGAFYSRIEGRLDAGKGGLKTVVASVRKRAREESLSPEVEVEAVHLAVNRFLDSNRAWRNWQKTAEEAAAEAIAETEHGPTAKAEFLLRNFEEWLFTQGFVSVDRPPPSVDRGYDLVAHGSGKALIAQARVTRSNASGAIRAFSGISLPALRVEPLRSYDAHSLFQRERNSPRRPWTTHSKRALRSMRSARPARWSASSYLRPRRPCTPSRRSYPEVSGAKEAAGSRASRRRSQTVQPAITAPA